MAYTVKFKDYQITCDTVGELDSLINLFERHKAEDTRPRRGLFTAQVISVLSDVADEFTTSDVVKALRARSIRSVTSNAVKNVLINKTILGDLEIIHKGKNRTDKTVYRKTEKMLVNKAEIN